MARARRLLWLSAFAGLIYLYWRWRNQQAETMAPPAYVPTTPQAPATPSLGVASELSPPAEGAAAPRRIPTRVHRGSPPLAAMPQDATTAPPASPADELVDLAPLVAPDAADSPAAPEPPPDPTLDLAPLVGDAVGDVDLQPLVGGSAGGVDLAPLVGDEAAATTPGFSGRLVNVNSADYDALVALPGIGPAIARRIIAYREAHGPFASVEQLIDVQGIGTRNIDEFRHLVTI